MRSAWKAWENERMVNLREGGRILPEATAGPATWKGVPRPTR